VGLFYYGGLARFPLYLLVVLAHLIASKVCLVPPLSRRMAPTSYQLNQFDENSQVQPKGYRSNRGRNIANYKFPIFVALISSMKPRFSHIISIIGFSGWMMSCGSSAGIQQQNGEQENNPKEKKDILKVDSGNQQTTASVNPSGEEILPAKIDSTSVIIDTSFAITTYEIVVTKDMYDAEHKKYTTDDHDFTPVTVYIVNKEKDSVVFRKKFNENQFVKRFTFKDQSINYISLSEYSGGSGFISTIYKVNIGAEPSLTEILSYNELSFYTFSKDGSELLVMQGIWDMSEAEDESHFSNHRYEIGTMSLTKPNSELISQGITQQKYPSYDYETTTEMLIQIIHKKEPGVFKTVDLNKYATQ
jgi:hypothetical protein